MNMAVGSPVARFAGHSLEAQARALLMNRVDTKFMIPAHELDQCLQGLEREYSMLEIGAARRFTYDTLYLDTPDSQLTLLRRDGHERVTVDAGLSFQTPDRQHSVALPGLAIFEIKYDRKASGSPLMARLAALGYRPVTFSKYCVGRVFLDGDNLKTNRFKPLLRSVHGICS